VATGRIYISQDVTFDEEVFPFSKLHPNARVRLWSEIQILPSLFPPRLDSSGNGCVVEPCAHATPVDEVSGDFFDTRGAQDDYSSDGTNSKDNPHVDSTLGSHPWQIYMVWLPAHYGSCTRVHVVATGIWCCASTQFFAAARGQHAAHYASGLSAGETSDAGVDTWRTTPLASVQGDTIDAGAMTDVTTNAAWQPMTSRSGVLSSRSSMAPVATDPVRPHTRL
jgi:hypothetical protein